MNEEERYKYNTALRIAIEKVRSLLGDNAWKPCDECEEGDCEGCAIDTQCHLIKMLGSGYTPYFPDEDIKL